MHDDRPVTETALDRLGFEEMAIHLANAIVSDGLSSGFVFAIEGAWGSGKSSLIKLTLDKLLQRPNSPKPQIIEFRPWLVGKREDLLKELFNQISGVVDEVVAHPHAGDARRLLKTYAHAASGLANIAAAAEIFEIPLAGKVERLLRCTGGKAGELTELSLGGMKEALKSLLREAKARIIIIVDDLDRLDPPEVVEVLRLVRAVADFPNVVYVTAYDADRISAHLKTALGTDDDGAYMEKVVQVSFRIPKPMTFDLVNWFEEKAAALLSVIPDDSAKHQRFYHTVHTWAPMFVETPRDVVRALNALHLHAVPVQDLVDPGDMVFLQLIRVKFPELFKWVEEYAVTLSRWGDDAILSPESPKTKADDLLRIIGDDDSRRSKLTKALSDILPGIEAWRQRQNTEEYKVFPQNWSSTEWRTFSDEKRLASKHHFSLYFSFSVPAGGISDGEVASFIALAKDAPAAALKYFKEIAQERRPQGGVVAEVLLSRIVEQQDKLDPDDIPAIIEVLGMGMDVLARNAQLWMGSLGFLRGDEASVFGLIRRLDEAARKDVLEKLFKPGMSYSWLCGIIREAIFEHGLAGDRAKPEGERLLKTGEFNLIRQLYLDMIRKAEPATLLGVNDLGDFLYSWLQLGEEEEKEVRKWVASQSKTDDGLLNLLEHMGKSPQSPGGRYPLKPEYLRSFFGDIDSVESRISGLAKNDHLNPDVSERAKELKVALEGGKEIEKFFRS